MAGLLIALAAFAATHVVPALPAVRGRLIGALGRPVYLVLYSLLSLGVLAWVGHAFVRAPHIPLWPHEPLLAWVPLVVMAPALGLLVAAFVWPNPLSLGRRPSPADGPADAPDLAVVVRHPVPWAMALWACAHMAANGDVAAWLLFGSLLAVSIGGMAGIDAKRRRTIGADDWQRLAAASSTWPLQAVVRGRARLGRPGGRMALTVAITAGLYILVLMLHRPLIGVSPLPL